MFLFCKIRREYRVFVMKYDFDKVIDRRNTDSVKWGTIEAMFGDKDVLPLWVADMDFPVAEPITEALRERTEHPFYGYSLTQTSAVEAVVDRIRTKYGWNTIMPNAL